LNPLPANADAANTIRLSPSGASALPARVSVVAWNDKSLIYNVLPQGAADFTLVQPQQLVAVTPPAAPVVLPFRPFAVVSLAGDLVTSTDGAGSRIDYVKVDGSHAGSRQVPAGYSRVSGSPQGYLLSRHDAVTDSTHLYNFNVFTGDIADLGELPGTEHVDGVPVDATANRDGVAFAYLFDFVWHMAYISFAAPGHVVPLDDAGYRFEVGGTPYNIWLGPNAAAWEALGDASGLLHVVRAPLSGGAATTYATTVDAGKGDVSAVVPLTDRTGWTVTTFASGSGVHFVTAPAGGGAPSERSTPLSSLGFPSNPLGAVADEFVIAVAGEDATQRLEAVHDASDTSGHVVAEIDASPISAAAVAIGPGRAAWTDDSEAGLPVSTRPLHGAGDTLSAGPSTRISPHSSSAAAISVSGRRTAYVDSVGRADLKSLWLSEGGEQPRQIDTVRRFSSDPQVSGTRLLYQWGSIDWKLADLRSGRTSTLPRTIAHEPVDSYALWGNYLAIGTQYGSVWRRDLTGAQPDVLVGRGFTSVAIAGDYVAWLDNCPEQDREGCTGVAQLSYRNMATLAPAVSVVVGAPRVDTIALSPTRLSFSTNAGPDGTATLETMDVTSGSSHPTVVASAPTSHSAHDYRSLSTSGSRLAWVAPDDGAAHVTDLPQVAEQPRFLGNPIAPTSFNPRRNTWDAEFVTSTALSSCSVNVSSATAVVRTLECANADGDAQVSWDGTDANGTPLEDGQYTWTLTGANTDGPLLNYDSAQTPVTGTLFIATHPPVVTPPPPGPVHHHPGPPPTGTEVKAVATTRDNLASLDGTSTLPATGAGDLRQLLRLGLLTVGGGVLLLVLSAAASPAARYARVAPPRAGGWRRALLDSDPPRSGHRTGEPPYDATGPPTSVRVRDGPTRWRARTPAT
jgi:hypothetical protein